MRRTLARAAVLVLTGTQALAQTPATATVSQVPAGFPAVEPDSALATLSRDSLSLLSNPQVLHTGRWRIMLSFSEWLVRADVSGFVDRAMKACTVPLSITQEDRQRALHANPWAEFDQAVAERPMMVLSILPVRAGEASCADSLENAPHLAARGLQFLDSTSYSVANDPAEVELLVDGRPASLALVAQAAVLSVNRGATQDRARQLRAFASLPLLAPDSTGRLPRVHLRVGSAAAAVVDTVELPDEMLRRAWRQTIPWQVERGRQADAATTFMLSLPAPMDPALREANVAWQNARTADAAAIARWRLGAPAIEDRRFAQVVVGSMLASAGNMSASSIVLGDALREAPCLSLDARVDAGFRRTLDAIRPPARCVAENPMKILVRGLVAPGVGQFSSGRRQWGTVAVAAAGAAFGYAAFSEMQTRSSYTSYQGAQSSDDAIYHYRNASNAQAAARAAVSTGVAVWLFSAVEAAVAEHFHGLRLARVIDYGVAR